MKGPTVAGWAGRDAMSRPGRLRFPGEWVVWAVLVSALLIGIALPFGSSRAVLLFGALALGGAFLVTALGSPASGLAWLLVTAVVLPVEVSAGDSVLNASVPLGALCCAAWVLRLVAVRRIAFDAQPIVVATLVFMAVAVLSFLVGQFPWFPVPSAPLQAQLGGLALFLLSGGILLLVGHEIQSVNTLRCLTWLFVLAGGVAVIAMVVPGLDLNVGPVALTTQDTAGSLFFTWLVAMGVSQALWNRDLSRTERLVLLMVSAMTLARGLLLAFSWVSGWLPPLVALCTIGVLRAPRTAVACSLLLAVPTLVGASRLWNYLIAGESYSWATRVEALSVMWQVSERNAWLGLGPANYHFYTPLYPFLGYPARFSSHNNYVDLLAQTGAIGLVAFGWLSLEALRLALRLRARLPDGFSRAYATGAVAGLVGSLVAGLLADWIVPFVYNVGLKGFRSSLLFWFFLGGLVALARVTQVERRPARLAAELIVAHRAERRV